MQASRGWKGQRQGAALPPGSPGSPGLGAAAAEEVREPRTERRTNMSGQSLVLLVNFTIL